ncbi:hypothetical protein AAVH_30984, partial [Aphelenchoides avenae]
MSLTGDLLDTIDCSDDAYSKPGSPLAQTLLDKRVYWGNNRTVSVISESKRRKFNLILVVRACNLALLGISNLLIIFATVEFFHYYTQYHQKMHGCMLQTNSYIPMSEEILRIQLYAQMFTALLSTLVLLATVAALLAATYRSPQPQLVCLCYCFCCIPFCLFIFGLQQNPDGCPRLYNRARTVPFSTTAAPNECAVLRMEHCTNYKMTGAG